MKNTLAILLQFVLFLLVFGAFSLFPPFHIQHVIRASSANTRLFIADGLLITLALFLVILLIEAAAKRVVTYGRGTSLAFVLAVILGFLMKFGFLTRSNY